MDRYPLSLPIAEQDFLDCGWKAVLQGETIEGYSSMWQGFSAAARHALDEGRQAHGKVLWLIADACSMMLSPKSVNEPFKPIMVMDGRRSVVPDDLPEEDIELFSRIVDVIDDPRLKARLADLVWLKQRPRELKFALIAIDSYRSIPLDTETWVHDGGECWKRAMSLARMLGRGAGDRLAEIEVVVAEALNSATLQDGFLGIWLADLLKENGLARGKESIIAQQLESLAHEFNTEGDLHRAREYFGASANWFKLARDRVKFAEMTVAVAECWINDAAAKLSSESPSHMAAASFYESAIQTYRTIPRSERGIHRVDERIAELRVRLNESGAKSLDEMGVIRSPGIDLTQLVENARDLVRGKSVEEALKAFVNLHGLVNANELRDNAIESLHNHPFQAMFHATVMSGDGRVIAKRPGMSFGGGAPTDDDEIVIRSQMIRDYGILVGIVVQGDILPALEILHIEHRMVEADFVGLVRHSPIVPNGRELLLGKALFAGYDGDFVTALHLLTPQIEHLVRFHLKIARVKTTNIDANGIENEYGLSTLIDLPEADSVLGSDLRFEINALFCDPFGPNLRNELAHGLLDDQTCQSIYAIYAWWLGLKLVFNAYLKLGASS